MSVDVKRKIEGNISTRQKLVGEVNVGGTKKEPEYYKGEYEVTPTTEIQILETSQKYMKDDVTVKEIPYAEVTNLANGITVTIGGN